MLQLLQAFLTQGYQVTFATTATKTDYSEDLSLWNIKTESIVLNDSSFDVFVEELQPDIVVFDRFMVEEQFGWRVAECAPQALRMLNTEDLHSLRHTRQQLQKKQEAFTTAKWLRNAMTKREVASIYRSDLTLLVSSFEMELVQHTLPINPELLYHLPFLLELIDMNTVGQLPAFETRKDFICFGNGKHAPNVDAVKYLKTEIWPLIRKRIPDVKLKVYGAYLPQQIREFHNPKGGFYIHNWIEDLDSELQHTRINLAPLRFGAGIKGKLTQALQNGTPTITTPIGAEGMFPKNTQAVVVCDTAEEFAQAAVALYQDKSRWTDYQKIGVETINALYSKATLVPRFFGRIEEIQLGLDQHRSSNFIGSLLWHHTLASTKYLSKWIEAKNTKDS